MATQDLEKLVVQLSADFKSFEREMAKAQNVTTRELRKMERQAESSLTRVQSSMRKFGAGLLAGFGISGIEQLGEALHKMVSQTAQLGDLADRIGLGARELQGLQDGAVQADLSFEDLNKTLLKFARTVGEAQAGQGEYLKTLKANDQQIQTTTLG